MEEVKNRLDYLTRKEETQAVDEPGKKESDDDDDEKADDATNIEYSMPGKMFQKNVEGQGENVPAIARRLKELSSKPTGGFEAFEHGQERHEYVIEGKNKDGNPDLNRNIVIKKSGTAKGPEDLIQLLSHQKLHLWTREQNMKLLRE